MVAEQVVVVVVVVDGGTVVVVVVAVAGDVEIGGTTPVQTTDWPVPRIGGRTVEVDTVGDVGIGGNRYSANVHHDFDIDRIVGSYLVPGLCSVACITLWSV